MSGTQLQATANHYRPTMGTGAYRPHSGMHSMDTDDSDGLDVVGLDDHHHRSHHESNHRFSSSTYIKELSYCLDIKLYILMYPNDIQSHNYYLYYR